GWVKRRSTCTFVCRFGPRGRRASVAFNSVGPCQERIKRVGRKKTLGLLGVGGFGERRGRCRRSAAACGQPAAQGIATRRHVPKGWCQLSASYFLSGGAARRRGGEPPRTPNRVFRLHGDRGGRGRGRFPVGAHARRAGR